VSPESLAHLRGPGWQRLLAAARRRLERNGCALEGSIGITAPTEAERRVVIGITGAYRPEGARRLTLDLADLDSVLSAAHGSGLVATLNALGGPLRDRAAERRSENDERGRLITMLETGRFHGEQWYDQWSESVARDGTLTRSMRRGSARAVEDAIRTLELMPADEGSSPMPLPVLAELAAGDTKALIPGSPTATLVLRALAYRAGRDIPHDAGQTRSLWECFGVVADDLASQVLVLNLGVARDHVVAGWLAEAAEHGIPFRLTLQQLSSTALTVTSPIVHVCENPAVLRAAAAELGAGCAPLVCTEGVPSAACRRLLDEAVRGGAALAVRADFDWAGLRIAGSLLSLFGAKPWRMRSDDYDDALTTADEHIPLTGAPAASPWDPGLADSMAAAGRAVMEERILAALLDDLS
jgi:uncharacterized protein (TIGR02679 family)